MKEEDALVSDAMKSKSLPVASWMSAVLKTSLEGEEVPRALRAVISTL